MADAPERVSSKTSARGRSRIPWDLFALPCGKEGAHGRSRIPWDLFAVAVVGTIGLPRSWLAPWVVEVLFS